MGTASKRGGARERRGAQVNSTNGLQGICFRWVHRKGESVQARICIAIGVQRLSRGVVQKGAREALRQAIKLRRDAGLPAPGLDRAVAAFEDWRRGS